MEVPNTVPVRVRSHGRQVSSDERRRVPIHRRMTKGPLDVDDDPASSSSATTPSATAPQTPILNTDIPQPLGPTPGSTLLPPETASPVSSIRRAASPSGPRIDLSFLLRPALYHPIPTTQIPSPFLESQHQPRPEVPLEQLVAQGHFRHAATRAVEELTSGSISSFDHEAILSLLQTRLSCLCLLSLSQQASQEARPLIDWLARSTTLNRPQASTETLSESQLVPWSLRLLLQRLQTLSSGDSRRGIMSLYALATECRSSAQSSTDATTTSLWTSRLADLGIRVASELIEMNELEAAARHLESLNVLSSDTTMAFRKCLLWLRIGNVGAAEATLSSPSTPSPEASIDTQLLKALIAIANNDYTSATSILQSLHQQDPINECVAQNLAVCLLYTGHIEKACAMLESLVDDGRHNFSGLLFNLATVYELRTENAMEKKHVLAQRVADKGPAGERGWERVNADFKL